jgi:hypothetical protein
MRSTVLCRALLICAALALPATSGFACGPRPTVLDNYEHADAVVIARVLSVEIDKNRINGRGAAALVVERVYKGTLRINDRVVFWTDYERGLLFDKTTVGNQFLLYLLGPNQEDNSWNGLGCARTQGLEWATEDLLYLDNMAQRRDKTRVSGNYLFSPDLKSNDVANKTIRIIGEKRTYLTKTDANGVYEIYDLPPGNYVIQPEVPTGWQSARFPRPVTGLPFTTSISPHAQAFTLEAKKHVSVDLVFEADNTIEGSVVGPDGKPMPNVSAHLWKPDQVGESEIFGRTDDSGHFRIKSVAPGSYLVVLNQNGKLSTQEPFPRLFYPGVTERERATLIDIHIGETVKGVDLMIPRFAETITLSGVLLFSDGKPVADEWVSFEANEEEGIDGIGVGKTDSMGRFTIKVLQGVKGEIVGEYSPDIEEYKTCPELRDLIRSAGEKSTDIRSSTIRIDAQQSVVNLVLRFPFQECKPKDP